MPKPVKALVLTCDRYRVFTDHMISCYGKLWPGHPFVFHVPYQKIPPEPHDEGRIYIRCPGDIQGTARALLNGLDDEEMIYWCIDDKYPIRLDTASIARLHRYLFSDGRPDIGGLLFCRCRGMWKKRNLSGGLIKDDLGNVLLERKNYSQIWIHQYLKVKVLRHLFDSFPEVIATAKEMDEYKGRLQKPESHRLFVTRKNHGVFGESTTRGMVTANCLGSLRAHNLSPPAWTITDAPRVKTMGQENMFSSLINRLAERFR